jgi:protein-S-isoprenylcysteine O-methyltransferase Ste14
MSLIPAFEIGLWNAWIFMIWPIVLPVLPKYIIKEKDVLKTIRTSAPMKNEKALNVISMTAVIAGFIYSIFLPIKLNTMWFFIGLLIFLIGFFIDLSVLYTIRTAKPDKPFTTGPYRYSRNPMYIALLLIMTSISIMSLSWLFLLLIIIVLIHLVLVVPAEEKFCLKKFGDLYRDYKEKTPRWIGFPKK